MNGKMNPVRKGEEMEQLNNYEWKYALTFTIRNADTDGHIWEQLTTNIDRLTVSDKNAKYRFYICRNTPTGNPHAHGVLMTDLTTRGVNKCFKKSFIDIKQLHNPSGWYSYVLLDNIVTDTVITNTPNL